MFDAIFRPDYLLNLHVAIVPMSRRPTNMELRLESRGLLRGSERLRLKGIDGRYRIEAKRVYMGDEMCVLSLLHRYG